MSNDDGTYAPKSPDLSSFYSASESVPTYHIPYQQTPPTYSQPQPHQPYPQQQQLHQPSSFGNNSNFQPYPHQGPAGFYPPAAPYAQPQQPTFVQHHQGGPAPYYSAYEDKRFQPPQPPQLQTTHLPSPGYQPQSVPDAYIKTEMPPRKAAAAMAQEPEIMESPVRTRFPTARIKRIMQADEEVGKVAQQTPIAVGKALELFMVQLVSKSAEVAKEKNSKRISAQMLKQAIDQNNQWDFLRDIVSKVNEKEEKAGGKAKAESTSEDEEVPEPKKKGRGGRRKKAA